MMDRLIGKYVAVFFCCFLGLSAFAQYQPELVDEKLPIHRPIELKIHGSVQLSGKSKKNAKTTLCLYNQTELISSSNTSLWGDFELTIGKEIITNYPLDSVRLVIQKAGYASQTITVNSVLGSSKQVIVNLVPGNESGTNSSDACKQAIIEPSGHSKMAF